MNSKKLEKIDEEINKNSSADVSESFVDISRIIIPFSMIFKSYKTRDIYSGTEKITFKERDPEYNIILRQEFLR